MSTPRILHAQNQSDQNRALAMLISVKNRQASIYTG